jgi:hypothetical protein
MKKLASRISAVELPVRLVFALVGGSVFVGAGAAVVFGAIDVSTYLAACTSGLVAFGAGLVSWTSSPDD